MVEEKYKDVIDRLYGAGVRQRTQSGRDGEQRTQRKDFVRARIQKAAVLGAGTMGAQVAAHLAGCGLDVVLLDVAGPGPTAAPPPARAWRPCAV